MPWQRNPAARPHAVVLRALACRPLRAVFGQLGTVHVMTAEQTYRIECEDHSGQPVSFEEAVLAVFEGTAAPDGYDVMLAPAHESAADD